MTLLLKATDKTSGDWRDVPEGLWRWQIGAVSLAKSEKFGNYRVKFTLLLTDAERQRLVDEHGAAPEGTQQSWRTSYSVGLSLGWIKAGVYQTTKLVDFLASAFGASNQRKFRDWIASGGGPDTSSAEGDEAELAAITEWLGWWTELELYGTVRHEPDSVDPNKLWARFAGPMAVGSLPGQKDDAYQAFGRGKLRAMVAETRGEVADIPVKPAPTPAPSPDTVSAERYAEIFGDEDAEAA